MSRKMRRRLVRVTFSVVFVLAMLEVGVRVVGTTDADGQFYFQGSRLRPYELPIQQLETRIEEIERIEVEENILRTFIYDAQMGWVPRPDHTSIDGLWQSNSVGIRADREYTEQPADDTLRIALFGGSFTAGDEVSNTDMWATVLENTLVEQGVRAEVINFGVNAYGTDQAYLRWQALGAGYAPDIVVVGFLPENMLRNVNVIRPIYLPNANMLYSKPRFALADDASLSLVNQPALSQDELADVMRQFPDHELAAHEYHYQRMLDAPWWLHSRFLGVVDDIAADINTIYNDVLPVYERDAYLQLTDALVSQFAVDVEAEDTVFIVAYLPGNLDVRAITAERELPYEQLLEGWNERYHLIDVSETFDVFDPADWMPGGHYSPQRNAIVGQTVSDYISGCLDNATCLPSRFENEPAYRIEK